MLQDIQQLYGHTLMASDGPIGHVKDFYFDDKNWVIRYLVAESDSRLSGQLFLLSPHAFGRWDPGKKTLSIDLTRKQVENCPSIESHQPVSRQYEVEYYNYYGWPVYWNGGGMWGFGDFPAVMAPSPDAWDAHAAHHRPEVHLRSIKSVHGYRLDTADGVIGQVSGFRVDDRSWAVVHVAVETGHWHAGKEILIDSARVERISYEDSSMFVNLTRTDLQRTAANDVAGAGDSSSGAPNLPH